MLTENDIQKIGEVVASKLDLRGFATKDDLKLLPTRKEFEKLSSIFASKPEFNELKEKVDDIHETNQVLLKNTDKILKKLDEQEYAVLKLNDTKQDQKLQELAEHTHYTFKNT